MCGQFRRPIQRLCLTLVVLQSSQSLSGATATIETTRYHKIFPATPTPACGHSTRIVRDAPRQWKTLRKKVIHAPPRATVVPHAPADEGSWLLLRSPESPVANLQVYIPSFLIQHLHHPLLSIFLSGEIYFQLILDFSSKSNTSEAPLTIWSCFVPFESTDSIASVTLY